MILFQNELYELEYAGVRRLLHQAVNDFFYDTINPADYGDPDVYENMEKELEYVHEVISAKDERELTKQGLAGIMPFSIPQQRDMIEHTLREAGYLVEKSTVSRSLYVVNDEGQEVRISDHKRPAVQSPNGDYFDWEYDKEVIVKDNQITKSQLIQAGFSHLDSTVFYLG